MKKTLAFALLLLIFTQTIAFAGWVNGYTRRDGKYVNGYNRSDPNDTVTDNYSYKGNTNPYTGVVGTNYYRNNPTSAYYDPNSQGNAPIYLPQQQSRGFLTQPAQANAGGDAIVINQAPSMGTNFMNAFAKGLTKRNEDN